MGYFTKSSLGCTHIGVRSTMHNECPHQYILSLRYNRDHLLKNRVSGTGVTRPTTTQLKALSPPATIALAKCHIIF